MAQPTDLYLVTMANGDIWAVPVLVIAKSRAENYKGEFDGSLERSLAEDTLPLFADSDFEVYDWARNNMYWSEVASHAHFYRSASKPAEDWEESWCNGDTDIVRAVADVGIEGGAE